MRRLAALIALAVFALPAAARADEVRDGSVYARVGDKEVVLGNAQVERRWARDGLVTTALTDKRGGDRTWSRGRRDFALDLSGRSDIGSERFAVVSVKTAKLDRGG